MPAAPYSSPCHFVHTSRRIAEETDNAIWANQFDNIANRRAHIVGTAEEIWNQMGGRSTASPARRGPAVRWRASAWA